MPATDFRKGLSNSMVGGGAVGGRQQLQVAMKRSSPTSSINNINNSNINHSAAAADNFQLKQAMSIFNEDTMTEACALLLQDDNDHDHDNQDDNYNKLVAILGKCQQAYSIIQPHVTTSTTTTHPSMMPFLMLQSSKHDDTSSSVQPAPAPLLPLRRTQMMMRTGTDRRTMAIAHPTPVTHRQESDEQMMMMDNTTTTTTSSSFIQKKPRLGLPAVVMDKSFNPPPEALSFLQALNSQTTTTKMAPTEESTTGRGPLPLNHSTTTPTSTKRPILRGAIMKQPKKSGTIRKKS